jgi:aspartyl-tRNA(Asn)/glutamyl-tRNA(Gln) amidotransferase subunit C
MIEIEEVKKLQKLVKIRYTPQEEEEFLTKLKNIMGMIDQLKQIDSDGIEPLHSVCELYQRQRSDMVETGDLSSELMENVPVEGANLAKEVRCFIVPKVVE